MKWTKIIKANELDEIEDYNVQYNHNVEDDMELPVDLSKNFAL